MKSSFVINEIPFLANSFESIDIITFDDTRNEKINKYRNIRVHQITHNNIELIVAVCKHIINGEICRWDRQIKGLKNNAKAIIYESLYELYGSKAKELIGALIPYDEECILYSYWLSRAAYCVATIKTSENYKVINSFSRAHRYDLYESRNDLGYLPYRAYITSSMDSIYFISDDGREYYRSKKYVPTDEHAELKVTRLGTSPTVYRKQTVRKEKIVIASCSLISEVKRLDLIISLIHYLQSSLSVSIEWIHIGNGEDFGKIRKLAEEELDEKDYEFLGYVENSKIPNVYKTYDVDFLVNLSDSEGVPVSIMEAMSMGIPCIGRDVGGMREIIRYESGLLLKETFDDTERERVKEFVYKRLIRPEWYEKMSESTYQFWDRNYNADRNYPTFVDEVIEDAKKAERLEWKKQ